jgi:glycosyltransferase involved in cell wall biosynthesis
LLDLPVNLGIGGAMQSGFKYALRNGYSHAVQMDGDGQHPPAELYKLLQAADETGANVVIGSRYLEKQGFQSTRVRRWGIRYFRWLNRLLTGKSILDSTSGFRLLDRQALQLAALYYPDDYPEPESLVFFAKKGLSVVETPVHMKEREGGISSISGMDALFYCVKVTIAMFFSFARKI